MFELSKFVCLTAESLKVSVFVQEMRFELYGRCTCHKGMLNSMYKDLWDTSRMFF
jgi:hypothetical protein